MGRTSRKPATPSESSSPPNEVELPERSSVQRKSELVLRLLRDEALDAVSRESQVPAHELETPVPPPVHPNLDPDKPNDSEKDKVPAGATSGG